MKRILTLFAAVCAVCGGFRRARDRMALPRTSILIGQSAAFTGPAAQLGIQMRDGAKLWFDYVNAQGGVNGRKIELRSRDDKYESKLAAENTKKLIEDDRVFLLFAYVGTPTSAGVAADLHRSARAVRRAVHRRGAAARAVQPLRLQRPCELLRRNREDGRAPDAHGRAQVRRLLPERRLRPGRPRRRQARARAPQHADRCARNRRAQHDERRRCGEGDQRRRSPRPRS